MAVLNVISNVNFALIKTFVLHVILDRIDNFKTNHVYVLMVFTIVVVQIVKHVQLVVQLAPIKQTALLVHRITTCKMDSVYNVLCRVITVQHKLYVLTVILPL